MAKKRSTKKKTTKRSAGPAPDTTGKHLVIVESPTKARTINKYLGPDYVVMASVGHVRDLPLRNPKGVKDPIPGVNLDKDFEPTYDILPDKRKTVAQLKKAAKGAADVWFATDLDREGEAIAWHLAAALNVPLDGAKRVVFNAITKSEIAHAFAQPRSIDEHRVNAQQARRILDRIVGYQVSPLLWKKVAGGLSAGRVQSVGVRLVVTREREIEAFIPDEYWKITGVFATQLDKADKLSAHWQQWLSGDDNPRTIKQQNTWLSEHKCLKAELIEFAGKPFKPDNRNDALAAARGLGFVVDQTLQRDDEKAKGPAQSLCVYEGHVGAEVPEYRIDSVATKRSTSNPSAPFITSTLQQAAANRMGFALQRTMRVAQGLYEGIDLKGARGQTGLITYMRTDSTHLSGEALNMARDYIGNTFGQNYLPPKPKFYNSSNKAAQEAHEAIRPTDVTITPQSVRSVLRDDQYKLYKLIWERFVACQMNGAQWDSTTINIAADLGGRPNAMFKATGRTLVFDGFLRVMGANNGDDVVMPPLTRNQPLGPVQIAPAQHFTAPPPRYTEASLQKKLEEEGIGRPSTYAPIIQTIQDRKYVESVAPRDRRLRATDLGKVVTDMLTEAFPKVMDIPYTREMEAELDLIESEDHDWKQMLHNFYGPFKLNLDQAHETLLHAKAVTEPAPHNCPKCGAGTVYRFGRNGRFLSCATFVKKGEGCDYAAPVDHEGKPMVPQLTDIACPICASGMTKRAGRFGAFLGCVNYPECKGIVKLDPKKHTVVLPKTPPLLTDLPCSKCDRTLNMRDSKRGYWLSCSGFPKCRGRGKWSEIEPDKQSELEKSWLGHVKDNPLPQIKTAQGTVIGDDYLPQIAQEPNDQDDNVRIDPDNSTSTNSDAA